ncbi:MAG TPA: hypothetical protein VF334_21255 [Polyangia bacterium]
MKLRAVVVALALAGCARAPAALDLTIVADASLDDATVAGLLRLDFAVSGAETAHASYALSQPFADDRQERVVYQPQARAGLIDIYVVASDGDGNPIASGDAAADLATGAAARVTVTLSTGVIAPDGGDDLAAPDLQPPADLVAPDLLSGPCIGVADGTVCAPTTNPCKSPGRCLGGACGAIADKPAGTVCAPRSNACHTDGTCDGKGACGAEGVRPNGYNYDGVFLDRCCGGNPVRVDTAQNCGACGINCNGASCLYTRGEYYCGCSSNAQCWSKCCSTAYGQPYMCAAGNCATNQPIPCPGNATNTNNPNGPFYCHY